LIEVGPVLPSDGVQSPRDLLDYFNLSVTHVPRASIDSIPSRPPRPQTATAG